MEKFLFKVSTYISLLALLTLTINAIYVHKNTDINKDIAAFAYSVPSNIQICNLGSSHGLCSFSYEDVEENYKCFNFALSSQSLMYDYRILQNYKANIQKNAYIFIVISYFSFLGKSETQREGFNSRNTRYYKFLPKELIKQYNWKTHIYVNYLPVLIPKIPELFRLFSLRQTDYYSWDRETNASEAYKDAKKAYVRHIVTDVIDKNGERIQSQEAYDAIYGIIKLAKEIGAKPILITTPFLHEYNDAIRENAPDFFNEFYCIVNGIAKKTGISYYDYSTDKRFVENYSLFMNADHLNHKGARKFTNTLIKEVINK